MPIKAEGEFALVKATIDRGFKLAGQPVKRGSMAHDHDMYMVLADTATQTRDVNMLREYAPRLEELAERDGHKLYLAIAHRAWGVAQRLAGEFAAAETRLGKALELFNELDTRWQSARTRVELAELEQTRHNLDLARHHFAHALEAFELLGATPDIERTRAAMAAL